ncbi:MAG TPA: lipid-A-disaccharide synthase [Xanthobacteraceae bacterium]|jgi:lipid-A-disaccharide synthase|nr:lipid-A-disaccharide synthase [Xanthobacteraceae bacterium]
MSSIVSVSRPPTIYLVAGEESGDRLGAALMKAISDKLGSAVRFEGVGGQDMIALGFQSLFPIDELSIMGFAAIVRRLPSILRRIRQTAESIIAARPDALVVIDSPEFTHRVARRVRAQLPNLPIIDYVSPSVWAWRSGRAAAMRAYIDHVIAILPFEPAVHERLGGPLCTYVGHPLVQQISELRPNAAELERRNSDLPVVLVLPGSRTGEIRRLLDPFGGAIARAARDLGSMELIMPSVPRHADALRHATSHWTIRPRVVDTAEDKYAAFRVARAALAASGTVTLELALAGIPTVAAYRVAAWEAAIARRLIRAPSAILANLVIGENVVPEFLQESCAPEQLSDALVRVVQSTPDRERQVAAFSRLDDIMNIGDVAPSIKAADIVLRSIRKN